MSLLTAPRRERDVATQGRPPVVLPVVEIGIDSNADLTVSLDGQLYEVPAHWAGRSAVGRVVDQITAELDQPVRVKVVEADGSVFTDILTPTPSTTRDPLAALGHDSDQPVVRTAPAAVVAAVPGVVSGEGFVPGEQVAVAVVVAHQHALEDGTASLRLPPALLAGRPGLVMLLGQTSGTVALSDNATTECRNGEDERVGGVRS